MKTFFLILCSGFIFFLPHVYSLHTQQIFGVNKFLLILVFVAMACVLMAGSILNNAKIVTMRSKIFWGSITLFFASITYSSITSLVPIESFFGGSIRHFGVVLWILLFIIFQSLVFFPRTSSAWKYIWGSLIATGVCMALWSFVQWIGYYPFFSDLNLDALSRRSFAGMGQPNFLAQALIIPFFASLGSAIWFFWERKQTLSILFLIISFCIGLGFLGTGSRAGLIGLAVGVMVCASAYISMRAKSYTWAWMGISLSSAILIFSWLSIFFWGENISAFLGERGASIEARHLFWTESIPLLFSHGLFGLGGDMLSYHLSPLLSSAAFASENFSAMPDRVHTLWLDLPLQYGIIPSLLFLWGIFVSIKKSIENIIAEDIFSIAALSGIMGSLAAWTFGFPVRGDMVFLIICIAYIWRKSVSDITPAKRVTTTISIMLLIMGILSLFLAHLINQSERSLFHITSYSTEQSIETSFKDISRTPFLSGNMMAAYAFVPPHMQSYILQTGEKHGYQSFLFSRYQMIFYAQNGEMEKAKQAFIHAKTRLGNHFAFQYGLLQKVKELSILSPQEEKEFTEFVQQTIPQQYLQQSIHTTQSENLKIEKFFKHHKAKVDTLFQ